MMVIEHRVSRANTFFNGKNKIRENAFNKIRKLEGKRNETQQNKTKTMHRPCYLVFFVFEKMNKNHYNNHYNMIDMDHDGTAIYQNTHLQMIHQPNVSLIFSRSNLRKTQLNLH